MGVYVCNGGTGRGSKDPAVTLPPFFFCRSFDAWENWDKASGIEEAGLGRRRAREERPQRTPGSVGMPPLAPEGPRWACPRDCCPSCHIDNLYIRFQILGLVRPVLLDAAFTRGRKPQPIRQRNTATCQTPCRALGSRGSRTVDMQGLGHTIDPITQQ